MNKFINSLKKTAGFTLVELLVVVAIIGILAAGLLIVVDPAEQINKASDNTVKQAVDELYSTTFRTAANNPTLGYVLPTVPTQPSNYGAYKIGWINTTAGAVSPWTATNSTDVFVCGELKSKASGTANIFVACGGRKYTGTSVFSTCTGYSTTTLTACPTP